MILSPFVFSNFFSNTRDLSISYMNSASKANCSSQSLWVRGDAQRRVWEPDNQASEKVGWPRAFSHALESLTVLRLQMILYPPTPACKGERALRRVLELQQQQLWIGQAMLFSCSQETWLENNRCFLLFLYRCEIVPKRSSFLLESGATSRSMFDRPFNLRAFLAFWRAMFAL